MRAWVLGGLGGGVSEEFGEVVECSGAATFLGNTGAVVSDGAWKGSGGIQAGSGRAVEASPADFALTGFLKILAEGVGSSGARIRCWETSSTRAEVSGRASCRHEGRESGAGAGPTSFARLARNLSGQILVLSNVAWKRRVHSGRRAGVSSEALLALHDACQLGVGRECSGRAAVVVGTASSSGAEVASGARIGNKIVRARRTEVTFGADSASGSGSCLLRGRVRSRRARMGKTGAVGAVVSAGAEDHGGGSGSSKRAVHSSDASSTRNSNCSSGGCQAIGSRRARNGNGGSGGAVRAEGTFRSSRSGGCGLRRAGVSRSAGSALKAVVAAVLTGGARTRR